MTWIAHCPHCVTSTMHTVAADNMVICMTCQNGGGAMPLKEVLNHIKALQPGDMKGLVEGVKEILYQKKVCTTCGGIIDGRRCWSCYESGPYDPVE